LLRRYDQGQAKLPETLKALLAYEQIYNPQRDSTESNRRVLEDRPWKACGCEICEHLGIHVIIFRGAERNRRRGLHNVRVFYQKMRAETAAREVPAVS